MSKYFPRHRPDYDPSRYAIPAEAPPLYQYTKPGGLLGIIRTQALWLTHVQYQNDQNEFTHAVDLFKQILVDEYDINPDIYLRFMSDSQGLYPVYTSSFTTKKDLLSQWRGYCPKGGYSYCIKREQLQSILEPNDLQLVECMYDDDDKKRFIREQVIGITSEQYKLSKTGTGPKSPLSTDHINWSRSIKVIGRKMLNYAPIMKDASFKEESEWRIITYNYFAQLPPGPFDVPSMRFGNDEIKFREGTDSLIPYLEISLVGEGFDKVIFDEIIVSPNPSPRLAKQACQLLVREQSDPPCIVSNSSIPYKNW